KPPGLGTMRVLQCDKRNSAAPAMQERLAIGEVWIAKMISANCGVTAAFHGIVQKHADEFLVLSKLPDEPAACPFQPGQPALAKFLPVCRLLFCQWRANGGIFGSDH